MELTIVCPHCDLESVRDVEEEDLGTSFYCGRCQMAVPIPDSFTREDDKESKQGLVPQLERLKWVFPEDSAQTEALPVRNCCAIDSQGHILACLQNELFALETKNDGVRVVWKHSTGGYIPGSPAVGQDGNVRVHSCDGLLHCVNSDGDLCWEPVPVGEPLGWASPVTDLECNTWVCAYSGGLVKVDVQGQTARRPFFRSPCKFDCTPFISNDILYVGGEDQFVYAVELTVARGKNRWDQSMNQGRTGWFINSAPVLTQNGLLVVASGDQYLYGFQRDGKLAWKTKLPGQALAGPVLDSDERLYIGLCRVVRGQPGRGSLVCVDLRSQKIQWEYQADGPVESTPVIGDDGIVYFGDNAGAVHAVASGGQETWKEQTGVAVRSAGAIAGPGQLIFGLDNGSLIALECTSHCLAGGWPKYGRTPDQSGVITTE